MSAALSTLPDVHGRFGPYGGRYVPETLMHALRQLSEHYDAARTVRMRDGLLGVSDGPAVNADAFLTGYFLIEVESFETAINWAARIPNARTGSVEVRPVMDIDW